MTTSRADGESRIVLESAELTVELLPDRGARVRSLVDRRTGREWLVRRNGSRRAGPAPGSSPGTLRAEDELAGWDECVPNIAPGDGPDGVGMLPDHGDVWSRAWRCEARAAIATCEIDGVVLPYTFGRTLTVDGSTLTAAYTMSNRSRRTFPVVWAMHMLVDVPVSAVAIPGATPVRVDSSFGAAETVVPPDREHRWDAVRDQLDRLDGAWAAKLFTSPGSVTAVGVKTDHGTLDIRMAAGPELPTFGIWLNSGAWPPEGSERHVGIEPGFGDHDDLRAAADAGSALVLPSLGTREWQVVIEVGAP